MSVSSTETLKNRVKAMRLAQGWSQDDLAGRSGLSRSGISAIEIERLVPSAAAALALAKAFGCRVEDLFTLDCQDRPAVAWAWQPGPGTTRYWHAQIGGRRVLFPGDALAEGVLPHDGVFDGTTLAEAPQAEAERTLVMACCDPAVELLAHELARRAQVRLLAIPRSSRQALDLLRRGLVHVAGVHLSRVSEDGNLSAAREQLGEGSSFNLLRVARWQEGLAVAPRHHLQSVRSAVQAKLRWIGRETGSGARQCLEEVRGARRPPRHHAHSHRGVAEAIRAGLADAGICLRLVSDAAGLRFLSVREEAYDLCFLSDTAHDPRIKTLVAAVQSPTYRKLLGELPGYSTQDAGTVRVCRG